jgi:hypothetical protein
MKKMKREGSRSVTKGDDGSQLVLGTQAWGQASNEEDEAHLLTGMGTGQQ